MKKIIPVTRLKIDPEARFADKRLRFAVKALEGKFSAWLSYHVFFPFAQSPVLDI